MEEVSRDLEYEDKTDDWRKFFGYRSKKDFAEVSLMDRAAAWETTISVSAYNGFPNTPFKIQIGSEMLEVSRVSGHTFWVSRGVENTNAQVHQVGDKISVCSP